MPEGRPRGAAARLAQRLVLVDSRQNRVNHMVVTTHDRFCPRAGDVEISLADGAAPRDRYAALFPAGAARRRSSTRSRHTFEPVAGGKARPVSADTPAASR